MNTDFSINPKNERFTI